MAISAEAQPASLPLPGGQANATVRLHPLLAGEMLAPPGLLARPPGRLAAARMFLGSRSSWIWLPVPAFLIEHPGAGPILVDTGLHPSVAVDPAQNFGRVWTRLLSIRMSPEQALRDQLRDHGIGHGDVGVVVMTHLHYDHASGATQFPGATFLVERREWGAASSGGLRQGYHRPHLDPSLRWRAIDVEPEADLFGDGSVRLLHTPGHTPGHLSLLLRLAGGERLLLTADAAYAQRTLDERLLSLFLDDDDAYLASLDRLIALSGDVDHVVCGHDPDGLHRADSVFG